jgi:hypothetical protein
VPAETTPTPPSDAPWRDDVRARLRTPHGQQARFIESQAKRKVIRAGRRGGKTVGVALLAVEAFLAGRRVLYGVPTQEQVDRFWFEVKRALEPAIDAGHVYKNETRHIVELPGTQTRIKAKTAWNADTLRGDYADLLILDEWQLMNEDAWEVVGAPMMLDTNGDAVFVYTPPSLQSASVSKARDPRHAPKLYKKAEADESGRWAAFHFSSRDNPHISEEALSEIAQDMSPLAIRQEIEALDIDAVPGALWDLVRLDELRVSTAPDMVRIVVGVDPKSGDETTGTCGIIVEGKGTDGHGYTLDDRSSDGGPETWAAEVIRAVQDWGADAVVVETNQGGAMVKHVLRLTPGGEGLNIKEVWASRGKYLRAEPVANLYGLRKFHHVGLFARLEDEMCSYVPGAKSPNRLDAKVWASTELFPNTGAPARAIRPIVTATNRWSRIDD